LRVILTDLGEPLDVGKDDDREIQLTLTNRFTSNVEGFIFIFAFIPFVLFLFFSSLLLLW
jgi:hypothetical protein